MHVHVNMIWTIGTIRKKISRIELDIGIWMHSNVHGVMLMIRYVGEDFNHGIRGRRRSFT